MIILGIDPGYERIGIAIVDKSPSKKEVLLYSECFKTPKTLPFNERLLMIGQKIGKIITEHNVEAMGIETLFFNSNQKTAMGVSEARGVIMYEAALKRLAIYEYSPLQIKSTITSYGKSDKEQIIKMIPLLIKITKEIKHDDEYDAIAVALTCSANFRGFPQKTLQ